MVSGSVPILVVPRDVPKVVGSGQHRPPLKYNSHHYKLINQYYNISMNKNFVLIASYFTQHIHTYIVSTRILLGIV